MDDKIELRLAVDDDLDRLSVMRWQAREEGGERHPALTLDEFRIECTRLLREWMNDGSHTFWVACLDDFIVAHVAVHRVDLIPRPIKIHDSFGVITENYTRPEYRNQGIGSKLIRRVIEWARDQDYELLIVYPSQRARPYYARAGFSEDSEVMELILREYTSTSRVGEG